MTRPQHDAVAVAGVVRRELDGEQADQLAGVLGLLEDFWRQASHDAVAELAAHQPFRVMNPSGWADWLADYLGDQVIALRAATHPTRTGRPR